MSLREWAGLTLVLLGSLALWGTEALLLLRAARRLFDPKLPTPFTQRTRVIIHLLCVAYAVAFLYARFVEPDKLVLRRLELTSPKLPPGVSLRIAHATDLHAQIERRDHLARAAEAIVDLEPDIVFLTGDFLCNYGRGAPTALLDFLLRLPDVPVVAVPGNYGGRIPADPLLEQIGIEILHSERRLRTVNDVKLEIYGASPTRQIDRVPGPEHSERLSIFLEHFPALLPVAARAGWDLYLAGHTHGGQVRLPGYGAVVTLDRAGKRFEYGGYRLGETVGMVSAGLGMECRGAPQVRFFCPPEIVLIEIRSAYSSK